MNGRGRTGTQAVCLQSQCSDPAHSGWPLVHLWKAKAGRPPSRGQRGLAERPLGCCCGRILLPKQPKPWYPGVQVGEWGREGWLPGWEWDQSGARQLLGPSCLVCRILCATSYPTVFWAPWRSPRIFFQEVRTSIHIIPKCELALKKRNHCGGWKEGKLNEGSQNVQASRHKFKESIVHDDFG